MIRSFLYISLVISCNLYYIRIVSYSLAHNSSKFHKPLKDKPLFLLLLFSFKRYSQIIFSGRTNLLNVETLYYNFHAENEYLAEINFNSNY